MEDYKSACTALETEDITVAEGESCLEPFDLVDQTVPSLDIIWPPQQGSPSAPPAAAAASPSTSAPCPPTALPATPSPTAPVPDAGVQSGKFLIEL